MRNCAQQLGAYKALVSYAVLLRVVVYHLWALRHHLTLDLARTSCFSQVHQQHHSAACLQTVAPIVNMAGVGLQIDPTELTFRFELRKIIPVTLSLHNPTGERIAFKVKTTNPKKYCVRPSSGFVDPQTTKDVQVIMQAQREYPANMADCKDKFLVQWVSLPPHILEITAETFDTTINKDVRQARLRVNLIGPPKPPSPVPEGTEEEASPLKNNFQNSTQANTGTMNYDDRSRMQQQITRLEKDKDELKRRVQSYQTGPAKSSGQQLMKGGGFSLVHIIIAILVAFLIGRYL